MAIQSFNRYTYADVMSAENFDQAYGIYEVKLEDSTNLQPKYKAPQDSGKTSATSKPNYMTSDAEFSGGCKVKTSNQNALLSLMSNDDLEGIKNQIHFRIQQIKEVEDEVHEDEEGQVVQNWRRQ
jgi:hypothetical protein